MTHIQDRSEFGSLKTKLFYSFGAVAFGIKDNGFLVFLMFYYNAVLGLPAIWVSGAIAIALAVDAFADPIVGQISDNLRTRLGRRHPFMYAAALPVAISYWFLWNPPHWSNQALFFYLIALAIIVRTFITMYEIPNTALSAELTTDYDQRTSFQAFRYFFGWMGGLVMAQLAYSVFLKADATHAFGQLNPAGYPRYAFWASLIMFVAIMVSSLGTHRHIKNLTVPPKRRITLGLMLREMRATLWHGSFAAISVTGLFSAIAIGTQGAIGLYFNTYLWHLGSDQIQWLVASAFLAPVIALALATWFSRRFGKKSAAIALFASSLAFYVVPLALRLLGLFPQNGTPLLLPFLIVFQLTSTILGIICGTLVSSMMADLVEDSQRRTGRRSEGLFFAMDGFIKKAVSGTGALVAGLLLSLVHFPTGSNLDPAKLDPAIPYNLALVCMPVVALLFVVAIVALGFYRIDRATHESNLKDLADKALPTVAVIEAEVAAVPDVQVPAGALKPAIPPAE